MDESNNSNKMMIPLAIVALVALVTIGVYAYQNPEYAMSTVFQTTLVDFIDNATYKDGTYFAQGSYVSPGGPREINLGITVENGIVTDSSFEGQAGGPISIRFQKEFGDNYKDRIIGKSLRGLALGKVSGSSLTPKGFNNALRKIKTQAKL
jgi:hypothetical protein